MSKNFTEARARQPYRNHPSYRREIDAPFFCGIASAFKGCGFFGRFTFDAHGELRRSHFLPEPIRVLAQPSRLRAAFPVEHIPSRNYANSVLFRTDDSRTGMLFVGLPASTPLWLVPAAMFFALMDALRQENLDVDMTCDQAVPPASRVAHLRAPDPSL